MSRFSDTVEEVLEDLGAFEAPIIETLAERIARALTVGHQAQRADVEIRAEFPLERRAPHLGEAVAGALHSDRRRGGHPPPRGAADRRRGGGHDGLPVRAGDGAGAGGSAAPRARPDARGDPGGAVPGPGGHAQPARPRSAPGGRGSALAGRGSRRDRRGRDELGELRPAEAAGRAVRGGEGASTSPVRRGYGSRDAPDVREHVSRICRTTCTSTRGRRTWRRSTSTTSSPSGAAGWRRSGGSWGTGTAGPHHPRGVAGHTAGALGWLGGVGRGLLLAVSLAGDPSSPDPVEMSAVPAGEFLMGSDDPDADADERPAKPVHLEAFWIDRVEVTNARYARLRRGGRLPPPGGRGFRRGDKGGPPGGPGRLGPGGGVLPVGRQAPPHGSGVGEGCPRRRRPALSLGLPLRA